MRAVVVTDFGGPEVLELQDRPVPSPQSTQLLVEVKVAGVNFRDIYEREAPGYGPGQPPFVAGVEGTGVVSAIGSGVMEFRPGDHVGWFAAFGSYSDFVLVDERDAISLPENIDGETACALLMQGATAHYLTHSVRAFGSSDTVLVHAAAGGVGLLTTQILTNVIGARVIATTSTDDKADLVRAAGADVVLRYDDVPQKVLELTDGRGVAAVFDGVGAATWESSLDSLAVRGTAVLIGSASGLPDPVPYQRLVSKSLFVTRPSRAHYTNNKEETLWRMGDLFDWVGQRLLIVRMGGRYALDRARQAQEDLQSRRTTGKLILVT